MWKGGNGCGEGWVRVGDGMGWWRGECGSRNDKGWWGGGEGIIEGRGRKDGREGRRRFVGVERGGEE